MTGDGLGRRLALPVVFVLALVVFGLVSSNFATLGTARVVLGSQAVLLVLTLGLLVPLIAGDYDLSVASMLGLSAMTVAVLNGQAGWPLGAAIAVALAVGLSGGAANGLLVVGLRLDPFVVTLGTATILEGITFWISGSQTIGGVSPELSAAVVAPRLLGLSLGFVYAIGLALALWYVLEHTAAGRRLLFVGQGRRAAELSGVRVRRVRAGAFMASGTIGALAGVLYVGTQGGADPSSGATFLLPAFAAAFLGATTIAPGRFNPWGTVIAVYFLATVITGLQIGGAETFVQQLFYGGALVVAVALSRLLGGAAADQAAA